MGLEMTIIITCFDILLAGTLLWLAWQLLRSADIFKAIIFFISFGLLMSIAWVRMHAPDVALAEAAAAAQAGNEVSSRWVCALTIGGSIIASPKSTTGTPG